MWFTRRRAACRSGNCQIWERETWVRVAKTVICFVWVYCSRLICPIIWTETMWMATTWMDVFNQKFVLRWKFLAFKNYIIKNYCWRQCKTWFAEHIEYIIALLSSVLKSYLINGFMKCNQSCIDRYLCIARLDSNEPNNKRSKDFMLPSK